MELFKITTLERSYNCSLLLASFLMKLYWISFKISNWFLSKNQIWFLFYSSVSDSFQLISKSARHDWIIHLKFRLGKKSFERLKQWKKAFSRFDRFPIKKDLFKKKFVKAI